MFVHVCHNDLSPEFCCDVYCLDKNLCVLEISLVSVFSQNKRHLPICSLDKVVTYMDVKQNYHHYLQTDAEQLNIFKECHKVNVNDSTMLQKIHEELAHKIFSDVCIIQCRHLLSSKCLCKA